MSSDTTPVKGSLAWGSEVRAHAAELAQGIDQDQFQLGVLLYQIDSTIVDTTKGKGPVYVRWGYNSFREYAEGDLGMKADKAVSLKRIGKVVSTVLSAAPKPLLDRFLVLGSGKALALARMFEVQSSLLNIETWVGIAEKTTRAKLEATVSQTLEPPPPPPPPTEWQPTYDGVDAVASVEAAEAGEKAALGQESADEDSDGPVTSYTGAVPAAASVPEVLLPSVVRKEMRSFVLFNDQLNNVDDALVRAEEISKAKGLPTWKRSNLLSLICMHFLATNNWGKKHDPKNLGTFISSLEESLGVKLVAYTESAVSVEIVYGSANLANLVEQLTDDDT